MFWWPPLGVSTGFPSSPGIPAPSRISPPTATRDTHTVAGGNYQLIINYNYRPQRSWGKVMFLHVSVILFTRGVVVSQHALQVSRGWGSGILACLAGGIPGCLAGVRGVSRPTPRGVSRSTPEGVSRPTPGGCIQACTEADPPRSSPCWEIRSTSGRYAFY